MIWFRNTFIGCVAMQVYGRLVRCLGLVLLMTIVCGSIGFWLHNYSPLAEYSRQMSQFSIEMTTLEPTPPKGGNRHAWEAACRSLNTALMNACPYPSVTPQALQSLTDDVVRLKRIHDPERGDLLLLAIWNRIAECSPHAAEYCQRQRPWFDQTIDQVYSSGEKH